MYHKPCRYRYIRQKCPTSERDDSALDPLGKWATFSGPAEGGDIQRMTDAFETRPES